MNRQWTPSSGQSAAPAQSKELAATAIKASVASKKRALHTNDTKFSSSFAKVTDPYKSLIQQSPQAAPKPYTGFDPSVAKAGDVQSPCLSAASQYKLGLVGSGTSMHVADAALLHAGSITGASVGSWREVTNNIFSPTRRGPTIRFDDDDAVLRHFATSHDDVSDDHSESESVADEDADWSEFNKQHGATDDVLICADTSFNTFKTPTAATDGPTEARIQSTEDLVRLLLAMGKHSEMGRSLPKKLMHLNLSGTELPLWVLTLLFGSKGAGPTGRREGESTSPLSSETKPVAGSALAAASAIISFRVSQGDVSTVAAAEDERYTSSKLISTVLKSNVRDHLISLDLSNGALEPRYTPMLSLPAQTDAHYRIQPDLYRDDTNTKSKGVEDETPHQPEDEEAATAFNNEATSSAAVILLRDALQPTKVRVPISSDELLERLRVIENAFLDRQARAKREQKFSDLKAARDAGELEEHDEAQELEQAVDDLDGQLELLASIAEDAATATTDEEYEEALEALKQSMHKWMDVPPVLPNLQALSLDNNPSLFLDPTAITAESQGSLETLSEPNVQALEALKSLLQSSGPTQRFSADYLRYNKELQSQDYERTDGHQERYITNPLATLLLGNCGLNNATALRYIAEGLQDNTSLKKLSLASNRFCQEEDSEVFQLFSEAIGGHKTLESLDVSGNEISSELCKLLAEAIEMSFETGKTETEGEDVPDEEEEEEERPTNFNDFFEDIIPAEEDAPTVTVGLPPEEEPDAEVLDTTADPEVEPEEKEEMEENEEEEDAQTTGRPPKPSRPSSHAEEQEEEPEDEEAAAVQREQEMKEAEVLWRQKHETFVWGPERILFEFDETSRRRSIYITYQKELIDLKQKEHMQSMSAAKLEKSRVAKDRIRHKSGWSHLQILNLARNPIGDAGAAALASMLRHTVPLTEDDQSKAATEREELLERLKRKLIKEKKSQIRKQRREAKEVIEEEKLRRRAEAADADAPNDSPFTARGDGSRPTIPKLAVPTKNDDEEEEEEEAPEDDAENDNQEDEGEDEEEEKEEIVVDEADIKLPTLPALRAVRPGLRSLHHLNVSMCKIGSKGLKALSTTLGDNCKALKTLNLSRNRFGTKAKKEEGEVDEESQPKVDDTEWVSPGLSAFAQALRINEALVTLDLSFNKLYPNSIMTLAEAFKQNRTLKHLNLKGNFIGSDNAKSEAQETALHMLLGAFTDETYGPCSLETLILDQNLLGSGGSQGSINEESATLLASLCHSTLDTLSLCDNNLTNTDLAAFSNALYAMAMDKKTGGKMDGSMSGMGGRRSSITDMTEEELLDAEAQAMVADEEEDTEHRLLANQRKGAPSGNPRVVKAGTSFCVNTSSTLRVFTIDNNPLLKGDVAGTAIARVIQFCSRLHHISIGGCLEIGDSGFNLICLKVGSHPALTVFSAPRIGITALEPLTSALQLGVVPLTAVDLGDNDIRQDSLKAFCSAICAYAIEALGNNVAMGSLSKSPTIVQGSPPAFDSEDEDEDDCPPPPFDPNDEDVTPAQSMQRQASRMAILAASSSQIAHPNAKHPKSHPMVRYLSLWGRRGISFVLPEMEPLCTNGIIEDFFCTPQREVSKAGPTTPLFDPLRTKDSSQSVSVYEQTPSAAYYLHRCIFDGAYDSSLKVLKNALSNAVEQESPSVEKLTKDLESLKKEVLDIQNYLGFGTPNVAGCPPRALSIPLVNTVRHQIVTALVHEMRVKQKREQRFLYSTDTTPAFEDDDQGRLEIESELNVKKGILRAQSHINILQKKVELLKTLHQMKQQVVSEENQESEEGVEVVQVPSNYAKLIKQTERSIAEATSQSQTKNSTKVQSPHKRTSREEMVEVLSKEQAITEGSLLYVLLGGSTVNDVGTVDSKDEDALRRMRWQCLMNRLAMK